MDINKVIFALIQDHNSYPAVKLAWECQLPIDVRNLPLMSPSHYIKELSMTTEDRLSALCKQQRKLEFWDCGTELSVVPAIVVFQNCEVSKNYSITVSVRNISGRMQKVAVLMENSDGFSLGKESTQINKLAPGMVFKVTVNFCPHEDRDVFKKIVIMTKESRLAIPALGLGGKGFLNPPDKIDFLQVPVKHFKTRLITTVNIGTRTARFLLSTVGPFFVTPERGAVDPKESFTMEVSFYSEIASSFNGILYIQYDTGEKVAVQLTANAANCCTYISPPTISFDDTYIGLRSCASVEIVNDTSVVARFKWKQHSSIDAAVYARNRRELSQYPRFSVHYTSMNHANEAESAATPSVICIQCNNSDTDLDSRTDPFFPVKDFLIEPAFGEVQPFSSKECFVIFTPYKPMIYESEAYCEITGQERRLAMFVTGKGVRPKFTFGFDENFIPLPLIDGHENRPETVTDEVTFDISIDDKFAGKIRIGLFGNVVPKTIKNFITICTEGLNKKTYVGSKFHRVVKKFMIQGGDIVTGDGSGSICIFGTRFDDENFQIKHTGRGFVSMANSGPNSNGCQFFITTDATPWLDGHHVVFGKVIDGLDLVDEIESIPTRSNDRPIIDAVITACSVIKLEQPYDLQLGELIE